MIISIGSCPDNKEILHSNVLVIIGIRNVMSLKDMTRSQML